MKVISLDVAKDHVMGNYPNDPLLRTVVMTLLDSLPNFEHDQNDSRVRELEGQIAQMEAENEWKRFGKLNPPRFDDYLCVVIRPVIGGKFCKEQRVLHWSGDWNCEGMIVTHFKALQTMPEDEVYG